jgi:hypothetical protein
VSTQLTPKPDWHTELVNESLRKENKSLNAIPGVPGNGHEYLRLRELSEEAARERDAIEAFNLFLKRWVHPDWWGHIMDDDDNDAEYVRRAIRRVVQGEMCPSTPCDE